MDRAVLKGADLMFGLSRRMENFINGLLAIQFPGPVRYALATLFVGVATGARLLLGDTLNGYPYLLYFPVVILCSLVLEHGTGFYATFLSAFLSIFLFVEPRYQLALASTGDTVALILFIVTNLVISGIIEATHLGIKQLKASRDETRKVLEERDLLLRELNHRVKNNFQAASYLLRIQARQVVHPGTKEALQAAADQISIMGRVHARLSQRDHGKRVDQRVDLGVFLRELADDFQAALIGSRLISLELDVEDIAVDRNQAVPIGLIINELLTNAIKYAFSDDRPGRVRLILTREDENIVLQVADNGVGAPPEVSETTGLGTGLVRSLVQMLDGTLEVESMHGMSYTVRVPMHQE
jgi:two-component sensor histidine kinase